MMQGKDAVVRRRKAEDFGVGLAAGRQEPQLEHRTSIPIRLCNPSMSSAFLKHGSPVRSATRAMYLPLSSSVLVGESEQEPRRGNTCCFEARQRRAR
jgi:hypothetical protein